MSHSLPPADAAKAQALIDAGYRSVSNAYRHVSRIDREDWREHMARCHVDGFPGDPAANFQLGMRWATGLGLQAGDFYRRVVSRDVIENVPPAIYNLVRAAGAGLNEYRPACGKPHHPDK